MDESDKTTRALFWLGHGSESAGRDLRRAVEEGVICPLTMKSRSTAAAPAATPTSAAPGSPPMTPPAPKAAATRR